MFYLSNKKKYHYHCVIGLLLVLPLLNCKQPDFYQLPAMVSENSINAVIEIPAGTNKKYEYNAASKEFIVDKENSRDRIIDFLPYPANYGFIPSTLSKSEIGGDGDALDVLIIAESLPHGTVVKSIPIALLKLIDNGEKDYKIIAVPEDKSLRIIQATTFEQLLDKYSEVPKILELWFLNYNPNDVSSVEGWGNENEALQEIKRQLNDKAL